MMPSKKTGLVTFKDTIQNVSFSTKKNFCANMGKWEQENIDEYCPLIEEWEIEEFEARNLTFNIDRNENPHILRTIRHIQFSALKVIYVNSNNI